MIINIPDGLIDLLESYREASLTIHVSGASYWMAHITALKKKEDNMRFVHFKHFDNNPSEAIRTVFEQAKTGLPREGIRKDGEL